jgi:hypothetical protein
MSIPRTFEIYYFKVKIENQWHSLFKWVPKFSFSEYFSEFTVLNERENEQFLTFPHFV